MSAPSNAAGAQAYSNATGSKSAVAANAPCRDHRSMMPEYHLYQVDHIRQIKKGSGITANCLDDAAAFDFAKLFFRHGLQVEVWSGTRMVGRTSVPRVGLFWAQCPGRPAYYEPPALSGPQ